MNDFNIDAVKINFDQNGLWVLNLVLAIIMFGVALEIKLQDFKNLWKKPKPLIVGVVSQFFLLPLITFLLVILWKPAPSIALGMMMVAACPGGNISNFMTHLAGGNTVLSVSLTAIATLLAIVMTPLNFQFWAHLYPPTANLLKTISISPIEMITAVMLLLGIPLFLGISCNHFFPKTSQKMAKILKNISIIIFVLLVILALSNNYEIFISHIFVVLWLVVTHNFVAFSTGFMSAKLSKLSLLDLKTITIETGIQNSGLGLLLIFSFFEGLGGMAILAAFWGIWHIVSGLGLAFIWKSAYIVKKTA